MRFGFELLVFALGALCAHDAWRSRGRWRGLFFGALAYAVAFEWIVTARAEGGFAYGAFAVHGPGGAPLWVPIGWACLLYAAMRTTRRLALDWPFAVALDACLIAAVGWLLDPLAVALDWWSWSTPGGTLIAGAPAGNYLAWLLVGACFSAVFRGLERRVSGNVAGAAAGPLALLAVGGLSFLAQRLGALPSLIVLELVALLMATAGLVRARGSEAPTALVVAVPLLTAIGAVAVAIAEAAPAGAPHLWWTMPLFTAVATLPHLWRARQPDSLVR